jgi:hypothetical protein
MNTNSKEQLVTREGSRPASAEQRLKELGIKLPAPLGRLAVDADKTSLEQVLTTSKQSLETKTECSLTAFSAR